MKSASLDTTIRRIQKMEPLLDECTEAIRDLTIQLDRMDSLHDKMNRLFS